MGMPVGELLSRISSRELSEWLIYFSQEGPTGDERADWRAAMIASTIANVHRDPKRKREPYTIEDFMGKFDSDEIRDQGRAMENQIELAKSLQRSLGGQWREGS